MKLVKNRIKLNEEKLRIKCKNILNKKFNKGCGQFKILVEVHSAQCSLRFYSPGVDNVRKVIPVFQGIFSRFEFAATLHVCPQLTFSLSTVAVCCVCVNESSSCIK